MATYQVFKETTLPGTLQANSIYLVAPAAKPDYVEMYVTGSSASTVKRIINDVDVQDMIDTSVASQTQLEVVTDITARNALTPTRNMTVLVLNATGDATVASGAATYVYRLSTTSWTKISEAESMDLSITWASITGKPTSAVIDIDDAVTKRHTHANLTQLNKIGEDGNGDLTYNGALPKTAWQSTNW